MATKSRANEICSFFIYDHNVLKKEEDDLKDAIVYFYPHTVSIDNQCALLGKLIGISDFFFNCFPKSPPKVLKFASEKLASRREGEFTIGLGCDLSVPDDYVCQQLDFVWNVFVFFQGSLEAVRHRSKSQCNFPTELAKVWDLYMPFFQWYGDPLSLAFQILPDIQLPKSCCKTFLHASHILQRCHRQPGVIGGVIMYKSKVLCTQLSPDLTRRLLIMEPQQSHFPCQEIKIDFQLPGGLRFLQVFLPKKEYTKISCHRQHSLRPKPKSPSNPDEHTQLVFYDTNSQVVSDLDTLTTVHCENIAPKDISLYPKETKQTLFLDRGDNYGNAPLKMKIDLSEEKISKSKSGAVGESGEITNENQSTSREIINEIGKEVSSEGTAHDSLTTDSFNEVKYCGLNSENGGKKSHGEPDKHDHGDTLVNGSPGDDNIEHVCDDGSASGETTHGPKKSVIKSDQTDELAGTNVEHASQTSADFNSKELTTCVENESVSDSPSVSTSANVPVTEPTSSSGNQTERELSVASSVEPPHSPQEYTSESEHYGSALERIGDSSESDNKPSPEAVNPSHRAKVGVNNSIKEEVFNLVSEMVERVGYLTLIPEGAGENQLESAAATDSETDLLTPLSKSGEERHFSRSSGTMSSSVSDDLVCSHKETLDFSTDKDCETARDSGRGTPWDAMQPVRGLLPSSESYVSSSYSQSESETSGNWMSESDRLVDLTLYVQGHSEMLLMLLLDVGTRCDKSLVTNMWKLSLGPLAELDFEVKENLDSLKTEQVSASSYSYMRYDSFTQNISGNVMESVAGAAHEFTATAANMHHSFLHGSTLTDMLLRSHTSSVYGHRALSHETFFQLNTPQKESGGCPNVKDTAFILDKVAAQKLAAHDITLL